LLQIQHIPLTGIRCTGVTVHKNDRGFTGTLDCGSVLGLGSWRISTKPANFSRALSRGELVKPRSTLVKRNFETLRKSH